MMRRLTCILAALAILIWTCPPAQAKYIGTSAFLIPHLSYTNSKRLVRKSLALRLQAR